MSKMSDNQSKGSPYVNPDPIGIDQQPDTTNEQPQHIKHHHHNLTCWPPKEGCQAFCQGLGIKNPISMKLWNENFHNRISENEIGFCIRNSCLCCLNLKKKVSDTKKGPKKYQKTKEKTLRSKTIKEQKIPVGLKDTKEDYAYGADALTYYEYLRKLESGVPRNVAGATKPTYRSEYILDEMRSEERKLETAPEDQRAKLREKLDRDFMPKHHHSPWFIIAISVIQLIVLIASMIVGGIARIGVEPKIELAKGMTTFRGIEDYDIWQRPNVWIGPTVRHLIEWGAIYAPCMRTDEVMTILLLSQPHGYKEKPGCCVVKKHDIAGSATKSECNNLTMGGGSWYNEVCSKVNVKVKTMLRPCCYGLLGTCKMTTKEGCNAHKGYYHEDKFEHCSQVFCFPHFCGSVGIKADDKWHFMPGAYNQGWRYLASLFSHAGILHLLIVFVIQWTIGRPIEAAIGHIRIALIYFIGAIGGNLVGSYFDPYLPQVGCGGAISTLIFISMFEVLQALPYNKKKYACEFLILILVAIFVIISGFYPFVNNFGHVGGLIFGVPIAFAIVPHLCFNKWNCKMRRIILVVSLIWFILFLILFIVLFYVIQDTGFCTYCYYFSCIPWTANVCNILPELQGTLSHD